MDAVALSLAQAAIRNTLPKRPGGYQAGAAPGTRRAVFSYGMGGSRSITTAFTDVLHRLSLRLPVTTTRWRLHVRNYDGRFFAAYTGALTFQPVYVGEHSLTVATGNWSGNFVAAPVQALAGFATPTDGSEYVSGWVTDAAAQFTAHRDMLISLGYTCAGGQTIVRSSAGGFTKTGASSSAGTQTVAGMSLTTEVYPPVWIEYEFVGDNPIGFFIGDSLTEVNPPANSFSGVLDSWPNIHAARTNSPAINNGIGGARLAGSIDATTFRWTKFDFANLNIDYAVVFIGTNDLGDAVTAAACETNLLLIVKNLRALGIYRVFFATIPPRTDFVGTAKDTERNTLNAWLLGNRTYYTSAGTFDFDAALRDPSDYSKPLPDNIQADGIHLTMRANMLLANAVPGRLA